MEIVPRREQATQRCGSPHGSPGGPQGAQEIGGATGRFRRLFPAVEIPQRAGPLVDHARLGHRRHVLQGADQRGADIVAGGTGFVECHQKAQADRQHEIALIGEQPLRSAGEARQLVGPADPDDHAGDLPEQQQHAGRAVQCPAGKILGADHLPKQIEAGEHAGDQIHDPQRMAARERRDPDIVFKVRLAGGHQLRPVNLHLHPDRHAR